jgi:para-nitrobenzyl esterase
MTDKQTAHETTLQLFKELDIPLSDWKKILEVPAEKLLEIQNKLPSVAPFVEKNKSKSLMRRNAGGFGPVVDGISLPHHPFDPGAPAISKNKPLLVGWNEDEYTFFAWQSKETEAFKLDFDRLKTKLEPTFQQDTPLIIDTYRKAFPQASATDIFVAISSITMMGLGSIDIAEKKHLQGGAPVYLYNFGYKSEMKIPGTDYPMGTPHAMDISFKFNNESANKPSFFGGARPEKAIASHNFAELWTNFAKTGKPFVKDGPEWPAFNQKTKPMMIIDARLSVINNRYPEIIALWRSLGKI